MNLYETATWYIHVHFELIFAVMEGIMLTVMAFIGVALNKKDKKKRI